MFFVYLSFRDGETVQDDTYGRLVVWIGILKCNLAPENLTFRFGISLTQSQVYKSQASLPPSQGPPAPSFCTP